MESRWSDAQADLTIEQYAEQGVSSEMALRVYTTRLLGRDPVLVLHGGGNTSVKLTVLDLLGEETPVLCVKGSGWDMADIEPAGLPQVRLKPLLRLRELDELSDEDMVNFVRAGLLDSSAPNPSVETLLHAFLPHNYVDHSHANAILSLTDQPDGESICRDVFGDRFGVIPYIMPGFALAKKAVEIFEARPDVDGLIALKHGIFTFADTARDAYGHMIDAVTLAQQRVARGRKSVFATASVPRNPMPVAELAPIIRGACAIRDDTAGRAHQRFVLDFRTGPEILAYVNGRELQRYSQAGVATPDHAIRTKGWPLILPPSMAGDDASVKRASTDSVTAYIDRYRAYFRRHHSTGRGPKTELDPVPRVVLAPGVGLFGVGATHAEAAIAADIAVSTAQTVRCAEAIGTIESITESEIFDIEYWSLEQAKLGGRSRAPLAGSIVLVTGGGGTIGSAIAKAFAAEGAEVAVLDVDGSAVDSAARQAGTSALAVRCDVTDRDSVRAAFDRVCEAFGGVDIVVSNAGAAWQGRIGDVSDDVLRQSFELIFFAHQTVAQNAVRVMLRQDLGGVLLFNVSKQAVNPGADFGAYGLPKAATLFLVRQYALDHGADSIRANAVDADRIRSGLLTPEMVASRASSRGVDEDAYMSGNLLGSEVTAQDVAQAFVHQALEMKTTANVTTVDGGNINPHPAVTPLRRWWADTLEGGYQRSAVSNQQAAGSSQQSAVSSQQSAF